MEQPGGLPKPSLANFVLALAFFIGACVSALVLDDSFKPLPDEPVHRHE